MGRPPPVLVLRPGCHCGTLVRECQSELRASSAARCLRSFSVELRASGAVSLLVRAPSDGRSRGGEMGMPRSCEADLRAVPLAPIPGPRPGRFGGRSERVSPGSSVAGATRSCYVAGEDRSSPIPQDVVVCGLFASQHVVMRRPDAHPRSRPFDPRPRPVRPRCSPPSCTAHGQLVHGATLGCQQHARSIPSARRCHQTAPSTRPAGAQSPPDAGTPGQPRTWWALSAFEWTRATRAHRSRPAPAPISPIRSRWRRTS